MNERVVDLYQSARKRRLFHDKTHFQASIKRAELLRFRIAHIASARCALWVQN